MTPSYIEHDDALLVQRLRDGDESAFVMIVQMHHSAMQRLALIYLHDSAVAEDVVQETWLAVLNGLDRFEGRSKLKTWMFSILINRAKTRAQREGRTVPLSSLDDPDGEPYEPSVPPERFRPASDPDSPNHWLIRPDDWSGIPEDQFLSKEVRAVVQQAIDKLPPTQRQVITLRDVEGFSADEVCNLLAITETNQRVLLHRARTRVQRDLEHYLKDNE